MAVSLLSEAKSHWTPVTLEVVPSSPVPKPAQSARWTTCSQECDGNHARMITSDPSWDMYRFLHLFFRMYRSCVSIHRHESSLTLVHPLYIRCSGFSIGRASGSAALCWVWWEFSLLEAKAQEAQVVWHESRVPKARRDPVCFGAHCGNQHKP